MLASTVVACSGVGIESTRSCLNLQDQGLFSSAENAAYFAIAPDEDSSAAKRIYRTVGLFLTATL
jgi:hypothetical protein